MKYLSCLVLLALISCRSQPTLKDMEGSAYRTSGVEQFFLPELPKWSNYSSEGGCFKNVSFSYMDFPKLREAYQLNYAQMVELQAQYNERLENYFRSTAVRFLKPMEEASFFSNTLEQVRGGVRHLKLPAVKEVDVIWFESFPAEELKNLARTGKFDEKLPILFSSCHTRQSLNQWITQEQLEETGFYLITAEWLSPFTSQFQSRPGLALELSELLGKEVKINIVTYKNKPTSELLP
jgi:hypothetical protein